MAQPPNVAILGCGMIVRRGHLPGLLAGGKAHVPVIYGPDTPNSHDLAAKFGIPRLVHSFDEVFATPNLNAVVVALPNYQHAAAVLAAIEAGLPVLLEKPIASSLSSAREVAAAADEAGVRVSMSLPQRQRPSLLHMKNLIDAGTLGKLQSIDISMTRRAGIPGYGGWFTQRDLSGGGVLMDLGPHVIDIAFWLAKCSDFGDVAGRLWSTHGPAGRGLGDWGSARKGPDASTTPFDVEDRAWFSTQLKCGTRFNCEVAWANFGADENRIRIIGDRGGADYCPERHGHNSPLRVFYDGADGRPSEDAVSLPSDHDPLEYAWAQLAETFVEDLSEERSRLVRAAEALFAAELIQQIYEVSHTVESGRAR